MEGGSPAPRMIEDQHVSVARAPAARRAVAKIARLAPGVAYDPRGRDVAHVVRA